MSNIDLIVPWPIGFDYPLFREFVRKERKRFHRVAVVWTDNHNGLDLHSKIEEIMAKDDVAFLTALSRDGDEDWRDVAMKKALAYSRSEWVWFTEQDFFPRPGFWNEVNTAMVNGSDLVCVMDQSRIHPCCLFIKRKVLEQTSLDFSAKPDDWGDHFGKIQRDLVSNKEPFKLHVIDPTLYYHMNGLTHNLFLTQRNQKVNYKPEEFERYLEKVKEAGVESIS